MSNIMGREFKKDITFILITGAVLTIFAHLLHIDAQLAAELFMPESQLGWYLRQYSQVPMIIVSVAFLIFIIIPPLRKKFPHLRQVALLWLFTLLFGAGLFVHTFLKDTIDRPRPRETALLGGSQQYTGAFGIAPHQQQHAHAEFSGKSFPSGHVAMAAMLMVPYFSLRRRKPKTAAAVLSLGVAYAVLVGYGRMVLGAHFFTDVVWGILCVALTAAIGATFIKPQSDFKTRYTFALMAVAIFALAWFNKFSLTLHHTSQNAEIAFAPQCKKVEIERVATDQPYKAQIKVYGYGGPTSWLTATETSGTIDYTTSFGIFRDLECEAKLQIPENIKHAIVQ